MDELKPCWQCGKPAKCWDDDPIHGGSWYIGCKKCGNIIRSSVAGIEKWNTRPIEDALQAKLDIAVEAIELALPILRDKLDIHQKQWQWEKLINNDKVCNPEYIQIKIEDTNVVINKAQEALKKLEEK